MFELPKILALADRRAICILLFDLLVVMEKLPLHNFLVMLIEAA